MFSSSQYMEPVFLFNFFPQTEQPHAVAVDAGTSGGAFSYEAWPEMPKVSPQ